MKAQVAEQEFPTWLVDKSFKLQKKSGDEIPNVSIKLEKDEISLGYLNYKIGHNDDYDEMVTNLTITENSSLGCSVNVITTKDKTVVSNFNIRIKSLDKEKKRIGITASEGILNGKKVKNIGSLLAVLEDDESLADINEVIGVIIEII